MLRLLRGCPPGAGRPALLVEEGASGRTELGYDCTSGILVEVRQLTLPDPAGLAVMREERLVASR